MDRCQAQDDGQEIEGCAEKVFQGQTCVYHGYIQHKPTSDPSETHREVQLIAKRLNLSLQVMFELEQ